MQSAEEQNVSERIEMELAALCSDLMRQDLVVLKEYKAPPAAQPFFNFRSSKNGSSFELGLCDWSAARKESELLEKLLRFCQKKNLDQGHIKLAGVSSQDSMQTGQRFGVWLRQNGERLGFIAAAALASSAAWPQAVFQPRFEQHQARAELFLLLAADQLAERSETLSYQARLELNLIEPARSFLGSLRQESTVLVFELSSEDLMQVDFEEESSQKPSQAQLRLYLGSLELQLEELLNLRAGSELSFPVPEPFQAVLELAGGAWAEVQVRFEDGLALCKVERLSGLAS